MRRFKVGQRVLFDCWRRGTFATGKITSIDEDRDLYGISYSPYRKYCYENFWATKKDIIMSAWLYWVLIAIPFIAILMPFILYKI